MMKRLVLGIAALAFSTVQAVAAETPVKFALDWKFEGPSAPYFVAIDNGYYKDAGLDVTIDSGPGSVKGIARVAAGTYPLGFFDINSLVKFHDQNPDAPVTAILMVYDYPPFAIVTTAKTGITTPKDLEGRILGAPAPDGAYAQWKAFVAENGIDASKVKIENVGFPVREPMLAKGDVDAITGYSFSSYFNLKRNGIAPEDIRVMLMADYGLVLYGNAIMVNTDFAKANPDVVKGFVAATIKGLQATAKDPDTAIKSVMKRNEIADEAIELERLKMALRDNIVTDYVKANGFGDIDPDRLAKSIQQIGLTYDFKGTPDPKAIFDPSFLPPAGNRQVQ
jgi:NitT/TauT family transport system substrate-binding protein